MTIFYTYQKDTKAVYLKWFCTSFGAGFNRMTKQQKHKEWLSAMALRQATGNKTWASPYTN